MPRRLNAQQSDEVLQSYLGDENRWFKRDEVLAALALRPGDVVADIGAGSGYFSWYFSRSVGPGGRVYAVDVDPSATAFLERRMQRQPPPFPNIQVVLSELSDVTLLAGSIDQGFLCAAHFFLDNDDNANACIRSLYRALKSGGSVAVIEKSINPAYPKGITLHDVTAPFVGAGFRVSNVHRFIRDHHFIIFQKPLTGSPPPHPL